MIVLSIIEHTNALTFIDKIINRPCWNSNDFFQTLWAKYGQKYLWISCYKKRFLKSLSIFFSFLKDFDLWFVHFFQLFIKLVGSTFIFVLFLYLSNFRLIQSWFILKVLDLRYIRLLIKVDLFQNVLLLSSNLPKKHQNWVRIKKEV